jgi:hypothetical protein
MFDVVKIEEKIAQKNHDRMNRGNIEMNSRGNKIDS